MAMVITSSTASRLMRHANAIVRNMSELSDYVDADAAVLGSNVDDINSLIASLATTAKTLSDQVTGMAGGKTNLVFDKAAYMADLKASMEPKQRGTRRSGKAQRSHVASGG